VNPVSTEEAWGRDIEVQLVNGRPCRLYQQRRQHVADLLADARRWAGRDYLVQGKRRITFRAFEQSVVGVADQLEAAAILPGDRVMLLAANSCEWVVGCFAVLTRGAIVVLGNAWWSAPEIEHALNVVEPALVLADERRAHLLPSSTACIRIETLAVEPTECHERQVSSPATGNEDDPAVIIFTSGTTGAPKAAVLSHRSVIANQQNLLVTTGRLPSELSDDHPGTVSLVTVPLFHAGGIQSVISALLTGGRLVFLEGRFDPGEVLRIIESERVRVWGGVPTMITRVLDHPDLGSRDTSSLSSLTVSGTRVAPELLQRVREAFPGARRRVGTIYGMTESGGTLTAVTGDELAQRPGCVGKAMPVVELAITGAGPDGVGEIIARSPTVMDGYWGMSGESIVTEEGWLRTGDLGRIDEEGYLYIVGRSKDVIIRGGENIACANVEAALAGHPAVAEVAVVGLPEAEYGEEVAAVVVVHAGVSVDADGLRQHAADRLAYFELPTRWWLRREPLPTNATGKVVKRALRDAWPDDGRPTTGGPIG
jgi:long-chain acyl-CoA synthetase